MVKLSVVVPVYNVEDYLALSVQSVREQTLADIEIICVNDGSPDHSGPLLELLASVDDRIVVVSKENGGLSSARNAGIRVARGEYVCFLDSDDLLVPNACETIVAAFDGSMADAVTYGGFAYPAAGDYPWLNDVLSPRSVQYDGFDPKLLFGESSSPFAWRTACRTSFLRESGLLFDETLPYGEDQVFQFQLYPRSRRTVLIPDKLVRYRVSRSGSFMDSRLSDRARMAADHIEIVRRIFDDWAQTGLLDTLNDKALDWAARFVMIRVFQLEEADRNPLLDPLRDVLVNTFDDETLRRYADSGMAKGFVKALVYDRRLATGNARRAIIYDYFAGAYGRRAVVKMLTGRVAHSGPWGKAVRAIKKRSEEERRLKKEKEWAEWQVQDERLRIEATERLRREAREKGSRRMD